MAPVSEGALQGRRALVAEHEAATRWSYVGRLREAGARVTEARDGLEALELARGLQPDLIVAGVAMPKLGGQQLLEALRGEPSLGSPTVVLVAKGQRPEAIHGPDPEASSLADAVLAVLGAHSPDPDDAEPRTQAEAIGAERENLRAQSTVAMYREPANRVRRGSHPIWRLRGNGASGRASSVSGFELDLRIMSRVLGAAFIALVAGTVALVVWREVVTSSRVAEPPPAESTPSHVPVVVEPEAATPEPPRRAGLEAFSGTLRAGVEPSLTAAVGQGVLELVGPEAVQVRIDDIDRGGLPLSIVLDEGVHAVRYTAEGRSTDRYYYVKPGFTRTLRVITRPGGFVDAR